MKRSLLISVLALSIILQQCRTEENATSRNAINPPIPAANIPMNAYRVDAQAGGKIFTESGTRISVPENAFVYEDNTPVAGEVDLNYREFHDAADIILSGIPMEYDSGGQKMVFETAGMFEITAFSGNKAVFIKDGKAISIDFASSAEENDYNFYSLDPESNQWSFKGFASVEQNTVKQELLDSLNAVAPEPVKPELLTDETDVLDFNVNYLQFPELADFHGVLWKYNGTGQAPDPVENEWIYEVNWTNVKIEKHPSIPGLYTLSLRARDNKFETTVTPVLSDEDYEKAMANFDQKMESYQTNYIAAINEKKRVALQNDFVRSFEVRNFGIYNWDRQLKQPNVVSVLAGFEVDGKPIDQSVASPIYLIAGKKAVVKYYASDWDKFAFSQRETNKILYITADGKVAIFDEKAFNKIKSNEFENYEVPTYTFNLTTASTKIESSADLRKVLNLI
ncbi:MAG: hypothetical protein KKA07_18355 [Bacteroidetes bacterium]|nr:hypothetical protein [Bacteroidota bacterium]MBU1721034.1 hypothetical protein [Bacteroidota bacterium]